MIEGDGSWVYPRRYEVATETLRGTVDIELLRRELMVDRNLAARVALVDGWVELRLVPFPYPPLDSDAPQEAWDEAAARPPSAEVLAEVDAIIAAHGPSISMLKAEAADTIDRVAEARITKSEGFEFPPGSSKRFSMSVVAQVKWLGLYAARDSLPYPLTVPTRDNQDSLALADANAVAGLYLTMVGTMKTILDGATAAKAAVYAASDAAGVQAAVESYTGA